MVKFAKSLYLHSRFFYGIFLIGLGFLISFWIPFLYPLTWVATILLVLFFLWDCIALFQKAGIEAERILPQKFSNSDENSVELILKNNYPFPVNLEVIDELPAQFQKRDFLHKLSIAPNQPATFTYKVRPVTRGEYQFGSLNIFVYSKWRMVKRRFRFNQDQMVKVYPSFIQMKKYDFLSFDNRVKFSGFKKIRRLGHTMEFEQIKEYVPGDDIRTINWKATAKHADLMVNQFEDENSQPVYSLIDRSRVMKMPFKNLNLLDYSINACLAFSNIALKRKDKVGMLSFSNSINNVLRADSRITQLSSIQESLYNIDTGFLEADYGRLYAFTKRNLSQRSLLMLYTNFEHKDALQRQLPYLLGIARNHLLVVILFENTELKEFTQNKADNIQEIFHQTIAEEFLFEKILIQKELEKYGIMSILTRPEDLSIEVINKYLEVKARGIL